MKKRLVPLWLRYALLCLFWWGVFGFIAKLGSDKTGPADMQILFTAGMLPLVLAAYFMGGKKVETDRSGLIYGIVIGVFAGLGGLAYFAAMGKGKASVVGPVTSLFPMVTVLLAVPCLKERVNRVQAGGVVLALIAVALLAS